MSGTLKVRQVGNSLGVVLSREHLTKLRAKKDDDLHVIETANGLELRTYDADLEKQLDAGRKVARKYRDALHELAK